MMIKMMIMMKRRIRRRECTGAMVKKGEEGLQVGYEKED